MGLELVFIPKDKYSAYRYEVIFRAFKWDPQVNDSNTVSRHVLMMDAKTEDEIYELAEKLSAETMQMENALYKNPKLAKRMYLPLDITSQLKKVKNYKSDEHVRVMRFDFHPTTNGWAISEVNSDVPGGFAEASVLPHIANGYFSGLSPSISAAQSLCDAFKTRINKGGTVAFVHCSSYSDDRQVMECIADCFNKNGYKSVFVAPDHIRFVDKKAYCILQGLEGEVDGIVRFFPLEWLSSIPKSAGAKGFYHTITPSCNHPVNIYTQSKRLPLVWDSLQVDKTYWQQLLPQTLDVKNMINSDEWVYKPALGRVGEGVSIGEAVAKKEMLSIAKAAKKRPKNWVTQKKFTSQPLYDSEGNSFHLCLGVFTVDGKRAGFYGRISPKPRIDSNAIDIPILIKGD